MMFEQLQERIASSSSMFFGSVGSGGGGNHGHAVRDIDTLLQTFATTGVSDDDLTLPPLPATAISPSEDYGHAGADVNTCDTFFDADDPEYARLGPCDLQDPLWVKMSAVASGVSKKRKKSDTKPQAQINKCNNEKRRREQENIYIEELAELISASFADMSSLSVKPDKCAILHETVNQIRRIKEQERARLGPTGDASAIAVQQGEVSSSRPGDILANADFAPYLLEALEGFLIIVSKDGRIEQCSTNIEKYIKFTYDEVIHKDFFNIIHLGDTARFSAILKPPLSVGWGSSDTELNSGSPNNRSFTCRFLVKPPDDRDASLDERQTRVDKYEQMHVCSAEVRYPPNDENAETCLMCIVRRIPHTEKATSVTSGGATSLEQFSTKLDIEGKIVSIDTSAVSSLYSQYINKGLVGSVIQELCPPNEVHKINAHLKEAVQTGSTVTGIFRLRFASAPDKYVNIQSTSKFFKNDLSEHIMSTHFIIGIGEVDESESSTINNGESSSAPVGGPLMTSVMNGTSIATLSPRAPGSTSSLTSVSQASLSNLNNNTSTPSYLFSGNDHEFELFHPAWELDIPTWGDPTPSSRPGSRHSAAATPVSTPTPRPPSASPCAAPCAASPLQPFGQPQPSPATSQNNPLTPSNQYGTSFTFSPLGGNPPSFKLEEQQTPKEEVSEEGVNDFGRLRNLLSKRPTEPSPPINNDDDAKNKHRILKGLLNQDDDDESKNDIKPRGLVGGLNMPTHSIKQEQTKAPSSGNNMLLKLLNEKSDDDNIEANAGLKKQSELLQQLLKNDIEEDQKPSSHTENTNQEDTLLISLGFTSSPSPPGRKRPNEDNDSHQNTKRMSDGGGQVSSTGSTTGNSKLWERNKMLAELLAKQPVATTIPLLPASVISATPQELPRIGEARKIHRNYDIYNTAVSTNSTTTTTNINQAGTRIRPGPGRPTNLGQILIGGTQNQNLNNIGNDASVRVPIRNVDPQQNHQYGVQSSDWDTQSDPLLSDILDQVIDIVPDIYCTDSSAIQNILEALDPSPQPNMNEINAINAIQKSLMQCETAVVKSPSSPSMSMPPGTPPAYSASIVMTQANQNQSGFPPPPVYQQRSRMGRGTVQYAVAGGNLNHQQLILQQSQRNKMLQQQKRLLQQQQQQQLLIPSNAAAELNSNLTNIDSLLNNTVAPNVSLQRSTSAPDSQLSPGYNINSAQRLNQAQQPYSPSYPPQTSQYQQVTSARLSPHAPARQGTYQNTMTTSQPQATQGWGAAQPPQLPPPQSRLGLPQQQNPMLNAQLTGTGYQNRPFGGVQRGNGMNPNQRGGSVGMVGSPGSAQSAVASRQSPYQSGDGFPGGGGGGSPTPGAPPYSAYQQQQLQRLQRTISAPTATTHLPGGLGSPRHYPHAPPPHHQSAPPPPHPHHPAVPPPPPQQGGPSPYPPAQQGYDTMQTSQYCYDQTSLQLAYNGADRGRAPPPPQGGGTNTMTTNTMTSEYVRQELRAVVGARTSQQGSVPQQQQQGGLTRQTSAPVPQGTSSQSHNQSSQLGGQQVSSADLEALGLTYEMAPDYYGGSSQTR